MSSLKFHSKFNKVGGSTDVRIPAYIIKHYGIEDGDLVEIIPQPNDEILLKIKKKERK